MSKNKEHIFDPLIWHKLVSNVNKGKKIPSRIEIGNEFFLSDRIANSYRFALVNRYSINSEDELSKRLGRALNKVKDLTRSNNRCKSENELLEAKVNFLLAIEITDGSIGKPIEISTTGMGTDENTAIALFSDSHVEENIDPRVVNGLNKNNPEISEMKVRLYFRRLLWVIDSLRRGGWKIDNLVLAILGDTINGYIHEEFLEDNSMSPTEAVIFIQELLIAGIKFLVDAGKFKEIVVVCKYGNHGRISLKKKYSTGWKNSYEYMMYTQMRKTFERHMTGYDNVRFIIERGEFTALNVYNKILCFSHGDHFNYQGGIGGMLVPFNRWIHKMENIIKADRYYIAHWHQMMSTKKGITNGSIIGYSPFAMGHGFAPEPIQQYMGLIDSKRGFTVEVPIILEDWK